MVDQENPLHDLDELESPTLEMKNFQFHPTELKVETGAIIKIINNDTEDHSVTAKSGTFNEEVPAGNVSELIAPPPGTYDFYCSYHPEMEGTLIVE